MERRVNAPLEGGDPSLRKSRAMFTRRDMLRAMALLSCGLVGCGGGTTSNVTVTSPQSVGTAASSGGSGSLPRNNVDVAIVGSGVAGLAAAQSVAAAGKSFVVLEARNRPGGRTFSDNLTFAPQPVDLGAQFFHQSQTNPLLPIAISQGIPVVADFGARNFYLNGALAPADQTAQVIATASAVSAAVNVAGLAASEGLQADVSTFQAASALQDDPFYLLAVAGVINGRTGMDITNPNSALDFYNFTELSPLVLLGAGDDVYIPSGMGNFILSTFSKGIPISLNSPVTSISWGSNSGVQLQTPQGTLTARTAIITVPISLLAAGKPSFSPALPADYQNAFTNIVLGLVDKVLLQFSSDPFGVPAGTFATPLVNSQEIAPTVINMFNANITLSFIDGTLCQQLESEGAGAAVEFVLETLAGEFGNSIRSAYSGRSLVTSWGTDPWAMGSYSAARPGGVPFRTTLGTPIANQLFFAGEAVSIQSHGSINGAYVSAQLAAANALAAVEANGG